MIGRRKNWETIAKQINALEITHHSVKERKTKVAKKEYTENKVERGKNRQRSSTSAFDVTTEKKNYGDIY